MADREGLNPLLVLALIVSVPAILGAVLAIVWESALWGAAGAFVGGYLAAGIIVLLAPTEPPKRR